MPPKPARLTCSKCPRSAEARTVAALEAAGWERIAAGAIFCPWCRRTKVPALMAARGRAATAEAGR